MNILKQFYLALALLAAFLLPAQASDLAKEKRWSDQVVDFLVDGEPHSLVADGQKFLAIYTPEATDKMLGTVILLHGQGAHPDWPQVISPLRTSLPEQGWATLSLQMPILPNEANEVDYIPLFKEVPGRIKAGIDFLDKKGIKRIVIIGHSLGATMAANYIANTSVPSVNALILIGTTGSRPESERVLDNEISLRKIKPPVLDIYGAEDLEEIIASAQGRANAIAKTGNAISRQVKIKGSNHFYAGHETELLETITAWLTETAGK
jgi:pimeloyl-ACP methyl ester carboxylesterase